ncbi:MAG: glycosyltransferase family 39 protein [Candidatus Moranbacteria bacterium]|nr:glycosyltransferase family 39 protein [Candidatus Moranbacteria bacterium]MBP6034354.1 glycosyltransferase family 39 protein [Candidatus Moranbacteria bacterium]MBP7696074.1 glycosyltransferase family 39 protein [Candidatus Moranbacteria bacterium]
MTLGKPLEHVLTTVENRFLSAISILLAINTLFFIARQTDSLIFLRFAESNTPFYAGFAFFGITLTGILFYYHRPTAWRSWLKKGLLATFPAWFVLTYGIIESRNFHYVFQIAQSGYMMLAGLFVSSIALSHLRSSSQRHSDSLTAREWFRRQGSFALLSVFVGTFIFFSFAMINLTKFAAVDEPLWYNGRIGKYWHNIEERDWKGTSISDKPGITVALSTGPGLWFKDPKAYKTTKYEGEAYTRNQDSIESFFLAFRLPELIVITLLLPLFYFFLERLLGRKTALFSYAFIATSPILIGMSKIINPDSLLWLFAPLSLLSYFIFLEKRFARYLILSGIFLGLALLTKYVANILFVFFIGLIFLEFLYHRPEHQRFGTFLKQSLIELGILTYAALATFYVLFPAVWIKPEKLLTSTIYSQAFEKVAPLFLILIAFILVDQIGNRARIISAVIDTFDRVKRPFVILLGSLFGASIIATLVISWNSLVPYDFSELLSSPKTIATRSDFIGIFLTNFYPLIFGILPLSLLLVLSIPLALFKKTFLESTAGRAALYLIAFILLYYLGATVNNVAMIVRYQIILFPIAAIIAGITLAWLLETLGARFAFLRRIPEIPVAILILALGTATLATTPFPLSYASSLLPNDQHTNVKDMGSGSYEAAQYLNSLPNAESMLVWTDKDGVCKFFIGRCKRGRNYEALRRDGLDYIVVSSDRKNRTAKMMAGEILSQKPGLIRFDQYYTQPDPAWELNINDRPSQYVRVYPFSE